jgi:hypothetical protein
MEVKKSMSVALQGDQDVRNLICPVWQLCIVMVHRMCGMWQNSPKTTKGASGAPFVAVYFKRHSLFTSG